MPLVDNVWYVNFGNGSSTGYYAVTAWSASQAIAGFGTIRRQLAAPTVGNERCFINIAAGTTGGSEPTWVITRGGKTTDGTVTWQECTGIAALNGDATNTPSWTVTATPPGGVKNTAVVLGQIIKRDSGASYQICTTAGTAGNGAEPGFSNIAGVTTSDNTVTWTSLGVVGNFTGWQAPHARLANSLVVNWGQVGNSFFVASEHAETQATAITLVFPSQYNSTALNNVICVTKTTVPPVSANVTTGASIITTGTNAITVSTGWVHINGITFNTGTGSGTSSLNIGSSYGLFAFTNCAFNLIGTSTTAQINIGNPNTGSESELILSNVTVSFASNSQSIGMKGRILWNNTASAVVGATIPTTLFKEAITTNSSAAPITLHGVDFSAIGSGKTLVGVIYSPATYTFINCKLGASVTVYAGSSAGMGSMETYLITTDSSATSYRHEKYNYLGSQVVETTIVRTGGASDNITTLAWKFVTLSTIGWATPFKSIPITIWNDSTSAITTLTIYGTTTGGGVPNNDDVWVEVQYLGSSATPQASFITTTKANFLGASATTNNSSDASTWGGGGAGNGFKMVVPSFTPGMAGPINITIKVAKASATYYIDPKVSI